MIRATKILGVSALVFLMPIFAFAQSVGPIFKESNCSTGSKYIPNFCTLCDLLAVIQNTINYGLILLVPIAAIVIIYGGFLVMTAGGNVANVGKGRTAIFSAIIGIAIAFGGWLIVNEVMNFLVKGSPTATPWYQITCKVGKPPEVATPPVQPPDTHLACQNKTCVSIAGAGANECAKEGEACEAVPPKGLTCSADKNSPQIDEIINCVKNKIGPAGLTLTGQITTFQGGHACTPKPPTASSNISCHYGGTKCNGTAHAADFPLIQSQRNPVNWEKLRSIADSFCGARGAFCEAGGTRFSDCQKSSAIDHVHVNDGVDCNCN